jgi:hypothetical protein
MDAFIRRGHWDTKTLEVLRHRERPCEDTGEDTHKSQEMGLRKNQSHQHFDGELVASRAMGNSFFLFRHQSVVQYLVLAVLAWVVY